MKGEAERLKILQEYAAYYEVKSHEGSVSLCDIQDLKELGSAWSECGPSAAPRDPYYEIIKETYQKRDEQHRNELLRNLMKAFAILELICINLFLYPWRKEIRIVKRFTGNFVYYIEPVIPDHIVQLILQRVGYTEVTPTEYIIGQKVNTEEAKQSAFELFLARVRCKEIIQLIAENKTNYADLFFTETSHRSDGEGTTNYKTRVQSITDRNIQKVAGFGKQEGAYNLNFRTKELDGKESTCRNVEDTLVAVSNARSSHDHVDRICNIGTSHCLSKSLDSEEFIKNYSDLNLAQRPIVLKHSSKKLNMKIEEKRLNRWENPVSEETNIVLEAPEPSTLNVLPKAPLETGLAQDRELIDETHDVKGESSDAIKFRHGWSKSSTEGSLANRALSEPTMESIQFNKGGPSGRSVLKLKIDKMNDVFLTYPIEETLPPKCVTLASSKELSNLSSKKTVIKSKEAADGLTSSKATFPISKSSDCTEDTENLSYLREPPNSTYIPPGGAERQAGRPREQHPEEDRFPGQPADVVEIDEAVYKMNTDTRDDFVIITRRENSQS
ncbi:uncharacterized protein LOC128467494 [Spea bombifrons]|uniref:uncharacterized protein LOC128467494 n=1 Tax=Spea bombifrons TaxID=233779 RepID=UPI00234A5044|nr:uncharacterized protein LOC128467494 [Spea bombifrons]